MSRSPLCSARKHKEIWIQKQLYVWKMKRERCMSLVCIAQQVLLEVLGEAEAFERLLSRQLLQGLVAEEHAPVAGVYEIIFLDTAVFSTSHLWAPISS